MGSNPSPGTYGGNNRVIGNLWVVWLTPRTEVRLFERRFSGPLVNPLAGSNPASAFCYAGVFRAFFNNAFVSNLNVSIFFHLGLVLWHDTAKQI